MYPLGPFCQDGREGGNALGLWHRARVHLRRVQRVAAGKLRGVVKPRVGDLVVQCILQSLLSLLHLQQTLTSEPALMSLPCKEHHLIVIATPISGYLSRQGESTNQQPQTMTSPLPRLRKSNPMARILLLLVLKISMQLRLMRIEHFLQGCGISAQ